MLRVGCCTLRAPLRRNCRLLAVPVRRCTVSAALYTSNRSKCLSHSPCVAGHWSEGNSVSPKHTLSHSQNTIHHRLTRREFPCYSAKVVSESITAAHLGSGSLNVFGTPAMIALMEEAACDCVASSLELGETTVGTKVEIVHLKCTPLGMNVRAEATVTGVKNNFLTFDIPAW